MNPSFFPWMLRQKMKQNTYESPNLWSENLWHFLALQAGQTKYFFWLFTTFSLLHEVDPLSNPGPVIVHPNGRTEYLDAETGDWRSQKLLIFLDGIWKNVSTTLNESDDFCLGEGGRSTDDLPMRSSDLRYQSTQACRLEAKADYANVRPSRKKSSKTYECKQSHHYRDRST